ncbi:unnamed protein product [Cylindrotheca closterium]|uniref:Cytochrome b5 heme-binding domain-containing protein n=1 Tax=Cylindrotheca closterium TaxID=2856 RepID=A0AAD2CQL5_9STRA|nr:unnamed protein product [Cylindrotheca closterium]
MSKSRHQDLFGKIGVIQDDTILHICSYLTPMSITNLACVNKATNELVDDHTQTLSHSIWQLLWFRDYGDVLLGWETSRNAVLKSLRRDHDEGSNNNNCAAVNTSEQPSLATPNLANMVVNALREKNTKEFYFRFQLAFVDYILAGQNSESRCLMGIHGHIFDFTDFAPNHPGLSEPIQLECGKDVTHFFEDVRHSKGARRIAQRLCLIVDKSRLNDYTSNDNDLPCGLYCPSRNSKNLTKFLRETNTRPPSPDESHPPSLRIDNLLPMMIRPTFGSQGRIRTLQTYQRRHQYERSQLPLAKPVSDKYAVRLYYDPFLGRWRGWHWKDEGQYSQVVFTKF